MSIKGHRPFTVTEQIASVHLRHKIICQFWLFAVKSANDEEIKFQSRKTRRKVINFPSFT